MEDAELCGVHERITDKRRDAARSDAETAGGRAPLTFMNRIVSLQVRTSVYHGRLTSFFA